MLPILEQLAEMKTHAERADWLQRCPFAFLLKHQGEIAAALDAAGFDAGVRCLEAELVLLASVRAGADGGFRQEPLMGAHVARGEMREAARRDRNERGE